MALDRKFVALTKRLNALEARIEKLERKSEPFQLKIPTTKIERRGRDQKIDDFDLFQNREEIFKFAAYYWPELSQMIARARSAEELVRFLQWFEGKPYAPEGGRMLRQRCEALWNFTIAYPKRYYGDPLQVADALAGVPKIAWRTSLNRCSGKPIKLPRHFRSLRDYLARKFPERFEEFLNADSTEQVVAILAKAASTDEVIEMLRAKPDVLSELLTAGISDWSGK
jgi:hypothetical protein